MTTTKKTTTLRSQELSCPSCVAKIDRELKKIEGVYDVDVRYNSGRIIVEHDSDRAGTEELIEAVGKAGYTAKASAF
jgi:copper chaperone CopZ